MWDVTNSRLPLQPEVGAPKGKGGGRGELKAADASRGGTRDTVGVGAGGGGQGDGREEDREGEVEGKGKLLRPQGVSMEEAGSDVYLQQRWAQKHKGFLAGRSAAKPKTPNLKPQTPNPKP